MLFQKLVSVPDCAGKDGRKQEKSLGFIKKINSSPLVHPYQPPIPFLQRVAWSKLSKHELKFA